MSVMIVLDEADARLVVKMLRDGWRAPKSRRDDCERIRAALEKALADRQAEDCPRCGGSDPDGVCRHQEAKP